MVGNISLDGEIYSIGSLNDKSTDIFRDLQFVLKKIEQLNAEVALLNRAKNAYIADLKSEVVESKSGIAFDTLFTDEF